VLWRVWKINLLLAALLAGAFLAIDASFLGANLFKLADGGYVPLAVGSSAFALALIWRWGRRTLASGLLNRTVSVADFLAREDFKAAHRVPGTGVFLTTSTEGIPPNLVHHFERAGALHEQVVLLAILTLDIPFVEPRRRLVETELGGGFFRVVARYGYDEIPNVPALLEACAIHGLAVDFDRITYILGRDALRLKHQYGLRGLPRRLFSFMSRNQASTFGYFNMPVERVIEIGMQLEV